MNAAARWPILRLSANLTEELTARELECMRWVAAGKTDAEIGNILSVSEATIKFHINGARRKLGARKPWRVSCCVGFISTSRLMMMAALGHSLPK